MPRLSSACTSVRPGIAGRSGAPPTFRKIRGAAYSVSPTCSVRGPEKRASPCTTVRFGVLPSQAASEWCEAAMILSFLARTAAMSTRTGASNTTPHSAARRATCAARALATQVFVGTQPLLTQVPPSGPRSISTVFKPSRAQRAAIDGPAWPAPITIASSSGCRWGMTVSPARRLRPTKVGRAQRTELTPLRWVAHRVRELMDYTLMRALRSWN